MQACPIIYQYVTDKVYKRLIEIHFPVTSESGPRPSAAPGSLTYSEANALRYAAGYVCRAVRKAIRTRGGASKDELLLCLDELLDDEMVERMIAVAQALVTGQNLLTGVGCSE